MNMATAAAEFSRQVHEELLGNILPFWLALRDGRGGFIGRVDGNGVPHPEADRGCVLYSRLVWSFSAAYKALGDSHLLEAARDAENSLESNLYDHEYGGVFWSARHDGTPSDTKKQLYAQAFAVYGLSEFYSVTHEQGSLETAKAIFEITESKFHDKENGGYIEALGRDFSPLSDMSLSAHDINADKTMNSHLHLLEAWATLYKVWPSEKVAESIRELVGVICDKILREDGHLGLYFSTDWKSLSNAISFGHDIETSWLLAECAAVLGDKQLMLKVKEAAIRLAKAGNEGLLSDGSMAYERHDDGTWDRSRQWWVQAEAVVGNLHAWKHLGMEEGLGNALRCWEYISTHLVDRAGGEWFWGEDGEGRTDRLSDKAGPWKCPYHNTRMCLETSSILSV